MSITHTASSKRWFCRFGHSHWAVHPPAVWMAFFMLKAVPYSARRAAIHIWFICSIFVWWNPVITIANYKTHLWERHLDWFWSNIHYHFWVVQSQSCSSSFAPWFPQVVCAELILLCLYLHILVTFICIRVFPSNFCSNCVTIVSSYLWLYLRILSPGLTAELSDLGGFEAQLTVPLFWFGTPWRPRDIAFWAETPDFRLCQFMLPFRQWKIPLFE